LTVPAYRFADSATVHLDGYAPDISSLIESLRRCPRFARPLLLAFLCHLDPPYGVAQCRVLLLSIQQLYTVRNLWMEIKYTLKSYAKAKGLSLGHVRQQGAGSVRGGDTYMNRKTGYKKRLPPECVAYKVGPSDPFRSEWVIIEMVPDPRPAGEDLSIDSLSEAKRSAPAMEQRTDVLKLAMLQCADLLLSETDEDGETLMKILQRTVMLLDRMRTDNELAALLTDRWHEGSHLVDGGDLISYATNVPGHGFLRGFQPVPGNRLERLSLLLDQLRSCYRLAVEKNKSIKLEVEFQPHGGWRVQGLQHNHPVLIPTSSANVSARSADALRGPKLEDLFFTSWFFAALDRSKSDQGYWTKWFNTPHVMTHKYSDELRKRCLYCAKPHGRERPQARFCNNSCRAGLHKLLRSLDECSEDEVAKKLSQRLGQIEHELSNKSKLRVLENTPDKSDKSG
jgi:hypothetical protein